MSTKIFLLSLILPTLLLANFTTDVIDAFDGSDAFDFNLEVAYKFKMKSSKIKREYYCDSSSGDRNCDSQKMDGNGIVNANNFVYTRMDHIIEPKLRFGLYKDLEFYIAMPIYLSSSRKLGFDAAAKKAAADTNGDGIVDNNDGTPTHNGASNTFWNAKRTGGEDLFLAYKYENDYATTATKGTNPVSSRVVYENFQDMFPDDGISYSRAGLSTLNIGFRANILDNDRDDTDPSWMIAFQYRAPIAKSVDYYDSKRLDEISNGRDLGIYDSTYLRNKFANRIDLGNNSMSDGVHWIKFQTALSKRSGLADAVMNFFYEKPMVFGNSVFEKTAGREYYMPGAKFGFDLGVEIIPWEKAIRDQATDEKMVEARFSIDLNLKFSHNFKGMELSEISDFIAMPTVVDEFSNIFFNLNLRHMPNKFVQLNVGFAVGYTTDHIITNQAQSYKNVEDPIYTNDVNAFNAINSVGSRILATEALNIQGYFNLQIQF